MMCAIFRLFTVMVTLYSVNQTNYKSNDSSHLDIFMIAYVENALSRITITSLDV